jgi:hypothetical protein
MLKVKIELDLKYKQHRLFERVISIYINLKLVLNSNLALSVRLIDLHRGNVTLWSVLSDKSTFNFFIQNKIKIILNNLSKIRLLQFS